MKTVLSDLYCIETMAILHILIGIGIGVLISSTIQAALTGIFGTPSLLEAISISLSGVSEKTTAVVDSLKP